MDIKKDYFYENYRLADFYDDQYGEVTQDIPFWIDIAKDLNNILEIACGTGRITIPLLKENKSVYGIDYSDEMLDILKNKTNSKYPDTLTIDNQDMRYLKVNKQFDGIFITSNSLNHIETNQDIEKTFNSVKPLLKKDGIFVFDILNPKFKFLIRDSNKIYDLRMFPHKKSGGYFNTWENNIYNSKSQINYVTYYYQFCDERGCPINDTIYKMRMSVRLYFPQEMDYIIQNMGFEIIHKYGWYDKRDFDGQTGEQIYVLKNV